MTKQTGHYTKENGLAENSIQKLLLQLAHNAGSMGFKRQDVYEGLQHVFPSSLTLDEKNPNNRIPFHLSYIFRALINIFSIFIRKLLQV